MIIIIINSLTEMNRKLIKIDTPPTHTHKQLRANTDARTRNEFRKYKENYGWKKTTFPSVRNIEWRMVQAETGNINKVLIYISTKNITELNELI